MELTVGQKLYFVPAYNRQPYEVEVKKVGRRWASAVNGRIKMRLDIETLCPHEDDGSGIAYLSREDYEQRLALDVAWRELHKALIYRDRLPNGVTVEKIAEARKLLGLDA